MISASWVHNLWITVALISLAAASHQGWSANLYTLASDMFPTRAVGSVVGIGGMGGAVGNIIDRLVRSGHGFLGGGVIDFIDPQWWPIFNVADTAISCGVILLLISGFGQREPQA